MAKNNLTLTLKQLDSDDVALASRIVTFSDVAPSVGDLRGAGLLPTTAEATISLPIAQSRQVYIKNTHGSAKITVQWTPNGGAKATILVLGPGDGIAFWHVGTGSSYGVSLLSLTSDTTNATYELFIGG